MYVEPIPLFPSHLPFPSDGCQALLASWHSQLPKNLTPMLIITLTFKIGTGCIAHIRRECSQGSSCTALSASSHHSGYFISPWGPEQLSHSSCAHGWSLTPQHQDERTHKQREVWNQLAQPWPQHGSPSETCHDHEELTTLCNICSLQNSYKKDG